MEKILDFLADNYLIFMIVSGVLLVLLILFLIFSRKKGNKESAESTPVSNQTDTTQTSTFASNDAQASEPTFVVPDTPNPMPTGGDVPMGSDPVPSNEPTLVITALE